MGGLMDCFPDGIRMEVYRFEGTRKGWGKDGLHFRVRIDAGGGLEWSGLYSVGSGIPLLDAQKNPRRYGCTEVQVNELARGVYRGAMRGYLAETQDRIFDRWEPALADVLGALVGDSIVFEEFGTFRDWVDEWGASAFEHPADALEAWEGCRKAARFVRAATGSEYERAVELASEM